MADITLDPFRRLGQRRLWQRPRPARGAAGRPRAAAVGEGHQLRRHGRDAAADAIQTIRSAEAAAQAGLDGKVGTQQVVEATMELETTVRIAVTMRDKLVEAYQQIMRMPI